MPLKTLRQKEVTWLIILCHGGKFALQVYENDKMIVNKSESKYVVRGKQGGRQLNADRCSGSKIQSLGSQMRRENEKLLQEYIANESHGGAKSVYQKGQRDLPPCPRLQQDPFHEPQ